MVTRANQPKCRRRWPAAIAWLPSSCCVPLLALTAGLITMVASSSPTSPLEPLQTAAPRSSRQDRTATSGSPTSFATSPPCEHRELLARAHRLLRL
jgi:hypothetical protein